MEQVTPASTAGILHLPFVREVEAFLLTQCPAAKLQRDRVFMNATTKAFNMSASYSTSCGSGAREQVQNWFDQCRVTVPDRTPKVAEVTCLGDVNARHVILDFKLFVATGEGQLLGMLLESTDQAGRQLLLLKNFGAQMTLDNHILGESTKRDDSHLAGVMRLSNSPLLLMQHFLCAARFSSVAEM